MKSRRLHRHHVVELEIFGNGLQHDRMDEILLCEICESWGVKRDRRRERRSCYSRRRRWWSSSSRGAICREGFLASSTSPVWVPSGRISLRFLHGDGDDIL